MKIEVKKENIKLDLVGIKKSLQISKPNLMVKSKLKIKDSTVKEKDEKYN